MDASRWWRKAVRELKGENAGELQVPECIEFSPAKAGEDQGVASHPILCCW